MSTKIAMVETNKARQAQIKQILRDRWYEIIEATPQGVEKFRSEGWDLLILDVDVVMPKFKGTEVLNDLIKAAADAGVPVFPVSEKSLRSEKTTKMILRFVQRSEAMEAPQTPEYKHGMWRSLSIVEMAEGMGISRSTLAQIIGISERNLARWISGETKPKGERDVTLQKIKYIYYLLARAFKKEAIRKYLREPNPDIGGRTPLMVLQAGDFASVEADLQQLIEGVYVY